MIINNNLTALSALNATKAASDMVNKSIKPLASGLKINSSSDDAAGLSISEKMRSQIKGYDMAIKNAQDGVSLLRTADDALGNTDGLLHRMRELSVQAGNDTLTMQDRVHIQEEIDGLLGQLDNVSKQTKFNTKKLLNGDAGALWSASDTSVRIRVRGSLLTFNSEGSS
ncbi:MAG: flagellin, partial [Synergistaceae bacterium]|nr:flagellin [Synergistaceae bacterium]